MSADVINLRHARKTKARADREREAAANRRAFGRTKPEKDKSRAEQELAKRNIDAHRREPDKG
jgi:hypothetical protein